MVFQGGGIQLGYGINFGNITPHFHLVNLGQRTLFQCPSEMLGLLFGHIIQEIPRVASAICIVVLVQRAAYPLAA